MRSRSLYNNGFILNLALGYISEPTWHTSPEKQDCFCFCENTVAIFKKMESYK